MSTPLSQQPMSALVDPGTNASLLKQKIARHVTAGFVLHNAGDERILVQVSGHFYEFEPHKDVDVEPRLVHQKGGRFNNVILWDEPPQVDSGVKGGPSGDPVSIAAQILMRAEFRGLCVVFDYYSPAQKVGAIDLARKSYLNYRVTRARTVQQDWMQKCRAAVEAGGLPPRQPANVRDEIQFLFDNESGTIDRKPFICALDGAEFDTLPQAVSYVRQTYAPQAAQAGGPEKLVVKRDEVVPPPASGRITQTVHESQHLSEEDAALAEAGLVSTPAPAPRRAVAPAEPSYDVSVNTPVDANVLLAEAERLKVFSKLTKAHLVALMRNDPDRGDPAVIEEILSIVDEARAKEAPASAPAGE